MANSIATQMREKMDNLEAVVMAIDNLASLATVVDNNCAMDFANLTHYLSTQLSCQFNSINHDLKKQVLPFVADLKAIRVA